MNEPIPPEACAVIATALPVLLLTGMVSDSNLERLRRAKFDMRFSTVVWLIGGLAVTLAAIHGVATGEGLTGEYVWGIWLLIGIVMAYIPAMVAARLYGGGDEGPGEADHDRDGEGEEDPGQV